MMKIPSPATRSMTRTILALAIAAISQASGFEIPAESTQCLVGTSDGWDNSTVSLQLFEKREGAWKSVSKPWSGRLGKSGLVWGRGLHPIPHGATSKQEGDKRSPAGVFTIGGAWGYAPTIQKHRDLAYRQVTTRDLWVEDPQSPDYNRNVILGHEPTTPWEKKQQMRQTDPAHALKLFIAHNAPPHASPNGGSSIFFHIWRDGGSRPTAGCTAMDKTKLEWLISQIDPSRHPLYILLPEAEFRQLRSARKLP